MGTTNAAHRGPEPAPVERAPRAGVTALRPDSKRAVEIPAGALPRARGGRARGGLLCLGRRLPRLLHPVDGTSST